MQEALIRIEMLSERLKRIGETMDETNEILNRIIHQDRKVIQQYQNEEVYGEDERVDKAV